MRDKDKTIDPLPDSFEAEEQLGAFWDAHSTMDYQQHLEATDDTIEISERVLRCRSLKTNSKSYSKKLPHFTNPFPKSLTRFCARNSPSGSAA